MDQKNQSRSSLLEPEKLEHIDIKWITPSEIPEYDFCSADVEILAKICEVFE